MEAVHGGSAKLLLPAGSRIHLTLNLSYLRRFDNDPLPGQATDAESPDPVITGEDPQRTSLKSRTSSMLASIGNTLAADYNSEWHGVDGQTTLLGTMQMTASSATQRTP